MMQPDLFAPSARPALDLPAVLERLSRCCQRPRYSFTVLQLIAQAAGPYVGAVAVRDWLCDALLPLARASMRMSSGLSAASESDKDGCGEGQAQRTPELNFPRMLKRAKEQDLVIGHTLFGQREKILEPDGQRAHQPGNRTTQAKTTP